LSLAEAGDVGVPTEHGMHQLKLQDVMSLTCDEWMSLEKEESSSFVSAGATRPQM